MPATRGLTEFGFAVVVLGSIMVISLASPDARREAWKETKNYEGKRANPGAYGGPEQANRS